MRRDMARVAPTEMLVGADDSVRPGPITQHLVGQGPCALPWVRENLVRADVGIGPYEKGCRGGRPQGSPLRKVIRGAVR